MTLVFRWQTILLVIVGACSSWFVPGGILGFVILLILALYICVDKSHWPGFIRGSAILLWLLLGIALLPPLIHGTCREASRRVQCSANLKQIGLALRSYEVQYGCLPPSCIYDATGRAKHSWRVLILPFLGFESLYKQYDFTEPWDGPNNRKLLEARPFVYACPADKFALAHHSTSTSYLAVVGAKAVWQQSKPIRFDPNVQEQLNATVLMIETSNSNIPWTEPKDFSIDDLQASQVDSPTIIHISHMRPHGLFHYETPHGINVALADGRTDFLPASALRTDRLEHLLTVGGFTEENVAAYSSDEEKRPQINWPSCLALPVWIAAVGLLLYQAVRNKKASKRGDEKYSPE